MLQEAAVGDPPLATVRLELLAGIPVLEVTPEALELGDAYAAQFDYDLKRIFANIKEKEKQHPTRIVKLAPRKPRELAKEH